MKKILIYTLIAAVIGLAGYTVYDYNRNLAAEKAIAEQRAKEEAEKAALLKEEEPEKEVSGESQKEKAKDFTLKSLSGDEVKLSDYLGKKVFINFWASWCGPCTIEMPDIQKLYNEIKKNDDVVILTINVGESRNEVAKYIRQNDYSFEVLTDTTMAIFASYDTSYIPLSVFIDEEGNIISEHNGVLTYAQMKDALEL